MKIITVWILWKIEDNDECLEHLHLRKIFETWGELVEDLTNNAMSEYNWKIERYYLDKEKLIE